MAQASHPTEFYRAVIKTEVVLGKIFVVVFKWIGMLVCDNTLTFAFQTQQQCAFQLTGRTAEEALASLFAARNIFSSSVPFLSEALQYQLSHHHSTAATLPSAPPPTIWGLPLNRTQAMNTMHGNWLGICQNASAMWTGCFMAYISIYNGKSEVQASQISTYFRKSAINSKLCNTCSEKLASCCITHCL